VSALAAPAREEWGEDGPRFVEDPGMAVGAGASPVLLIEGDNLDALRWLTPTHRAAIDVVYIDPPYNTGSADLPYDDRFADRAGADRHAAWRSFMAPRLRLARDLLTEDGVLIASIDDNEFAHLKLLLDEIFGERNFVGNIIRATNSTKSNSTLLSINYDHTYVYARDRAGLEARLKASGRRWEVPKSNVESYRRQVARLQRLGLSRERITEELKELTKYPRFVDFVNYWYVDDRGLYRKGDLGGVRHGNPKPLHNPLTGRDDPVPPGGFRFGPAELERLVAEDRIHFHIVGRLPSVWKWTRSSATSRSSSAGPNRKPPGGTGSSRPVKGLWSGFRLPWRTPPRSPLR